MNFIVRRIEGDFDVADIPAADRRTDRHRAACGNQYLLKNSGTGRLDVVGDLVGFDDEDDIAGLEAAAGRHVPARDRALGHRQAELGHDEVSCSHAANAAEWSRNQRPAKTGARFSRNAVQPSWASLVSKTRPIMLCS